MTTDAHALAGTPAGLFPLSSLDLLASEGFAGWLSAEATAIVCTTGNQILLIGTDEHGALEVRATPVPAVAGIAVATPETFHVACDWQLWRYVDARAAEPRDEPARVRHFLPQSAWTTGFVGAYDVAIGRDGEPLFASSITNCVATVSTRLNFTAVWKPPFVTAIGGGDRCHLTGLATVDGDLRYVSVTALSDTVGGWADGIRDGGMVLDTASGEPVATGLSLPHSPRVAPDGTLLVAAAGTGELLAIDRADGRTQVVARPGGFARGLAVHGRYAVVGASKIPSDSPYASAPIVAAAMRQALVIVDLERGTVVADLELRGSTGEIVALDLLTDTRDAAIGSVAAERDAVVAIATD